MARVEASGAAADADWILGRLARPAPMRTTFVELRGSRLLKKPLRLEGEYRRPQDDTLVRQVTSPYAETTTIRAGEVSIARGDKPPRQFSLARAPELAGLQASFGALLAGDRVALERTYRLAADGTRARWTLTLTPREATLAARLQSVTLYGRGDAARGFRGRRPGHAVLRRPPRAVSAAPGAAPGTRGHRRHGDDLRR